MTACMVVHVFLFCSPGEAAAQADTAAAIPQEAQAEEESIEATPEREIIPFPVLISNPTNGFGAGGGLLTLYRLNETDPKDSQTAVIGYYTTTDSWMVAGRQVFSFGDDRFRSTTVGVSANTNNRFSYTDRPQEQQEPEEEEPPQDGVRWDDGLWIEARRFDFRTKIGGAAQLDSAAFVAYPSLEDLVGPVENGVEWRRARIDATASLGRRLGFKFRWDFAVNDPPSLKDAWMEIRFVRYPFRIRAGRFGSTFGLENESSSNDSVFLEAGLPREFVPPQETGVLVHSEALVGGRWDFSFSGATDNPLDCIICNVTGIAGRYGLGIELGGPQRLLHLGGDYAHRWLGDDLVRITARPESNLSPVLVDSGLLLADRTDTIMLEGAFVNGPFSFQGEYGLKRLRMREAEHPLFKSFYLMATYSITGEQRVYDHARGIFRRIVPDREFGQGARGLGAFEVAVRASRIDLNDKQIMGGELNDLGIAFNWYPTHTTRVMGNVIRAKREGAAPMWVFQSRLQLAF